MDTFNTSWQHMIVNDTMWDQHYTTCRPYRMDIHSKGFWFGDRPTNHIFPSFMLQLILMFFISQLIRVILRPLKQPKVICNLLAGIILGPSVLGQDKTILDRMFQPAELLFTNLLSVIGILYFIFLTAVKMDKSRIIKVARKSMNVGLTCFILPMVFLLILFHVCRDFIPGIIGKGFRLYISSRLALSYFPVIANILSELNLLTSELGKMAISCAILHEIIGWVILALSVILKGDRRQMAQSVVILFMLILFITLVLRPMVMWVIRQTPEGKPVDGFYIKAILAGPLIIGLLSDMIGITILPGALMMGLIVPSGPPLGSSLMDRSELVISELILPFVYIRAGMLMNVHSIKDWKVFMTIQIIMFSGYLGKVAGCVLALPCSNGGLRNSFLLALMLNTKGVIEISLLLRWRARKLIDEPSFVALMISNIIVTTIVTPLLKILYKPQARLQASSSSKRSMRTLQSTLLTGEFRILCCIHSEDNIHGIISVLKACNSTPITPMCIYAVHLIDLVGRAAPLLHPYNSQRKRFKENSTDRIMRALTKSLVHNSSTIQPFRMIAPFNTIHESICNLARDKFIPLLLVPFPESLETQVRKMALHSFNINMQAYAPCTVGILVDRSLPRIFNSALFSLNVQVIFFGGHDDCEALALVSRMAGHPGVSITVLRINLREEDSQKYVDDCLIREFKARNIENERVVCREVLAETTTQVVDLIRSSEKNYDLVIVGKRKGPNLERELLPWVENEELGAIGDIVASSDFCEGMVSVLVIHCVGGDHVDAVGSSTTTTLDEKNRFSSSSSDAELDHKVEKVSLADPKSDVKICIQV